MARSRTKVELARGYPALWYTRLLGKAHMHLEIALVGHEYDGQRINTYEVVQMIERDIQKSISQKKPRPRHNAPAGAAQFASASCGSSRPMIDDVFTYA